MKKAKMMYEGAAKMKSFFQRRREAGNAEEEAETGEVRRTRWQPLLFSFLGGVAVGAVGMMLATPKSGRDMRQTIAHMPGAVRSAGSAAQRAFLRSV